MNYQRFFIATIAIVLFAIAWNGIVHLVILRDAELLNSIGRPESERSLSLSLLVTVILAMLFVWSYGRTSKHGNVRDGLRHGLFFGLLGGTLVDLNQYILYPIPASVAFCWFVFGVFEFCIYGIIASKLYPGDCSKAG